MANITRFNKFTPRDYSMKFYMPEIYVPDFQQWDSMLAGQQQKYNAAMAVTQKYPKHLEWRSDLAGKYKEDVNSKVEDVTNTYINEGVKSGNRKMRDFAFDLNQQWNPGGLAHELEKEFEDYQGGIKQITDYYEKNKAENSANRTYSLAKLKQAAQGEFKYDAQTGMYNRAGIVPELMPYVDIAEEAMKVVKEIKDSGTSDIIKRDRAWFEKIERTGVTEQTIKEVTDELLQQPKYAQQLSVEKWLIDQNTTPEQKAKLEADTKTSITTNVENIGKQIDKFSASKDKKEREKLQQELQQEGYYTGKIDGDIGKETKAAIDAYKADLTEKASKQLEKTTYDNIINKQMKDSYARPLIKAFARETVKRDLIFNDEWATLVKLQAQRQNTADLVTAIQSLKNPETSDYLATPGLASPMETIDKVRGQSQEVYSNSKQSFDRIAQFSGITDIIGYRAANKIHEVTQAKMQSKSYDDFKQRMGNLGYTEEGVVNNAWQFYNSPGAGDLYNAYTSMNTAKQEVDNIDRTKQSMVMDYAKTAEGKKEIEKLRKSSNFKGSDEELIQKMVTGGGVKTTSPSIPIYSDKEFGMPMPTAPSVTLGGSFLNKMNDYYKNKPEAMPQSLRGYRLKSIKGEGADLEKVLIKDIVDGYTQGYSSNGQAGIVFNHIGQKDKIDVSDVKLDDGNVSFNVDASGVTYYLTGKDANGKPVSAVVNAPKEHYGRLAQMALDLKKEAKDGNDRFLDGVANQLYAVTTEGSRYQNAVDDALVLNDKNTAQLDRIIDPMRSGNGRVETFKNNANVKGIPVGEEKIVDGLIYQKFKTYNPKTKSQAYMMTMKTDGGLYLPVKNSDGGFYYDSSAEAESPIWDRKMLSQLPVDIDQKTIKQSNISEDQARGIMLGAQGILENN